MYKLIILAYITCLTFYPYHHCYSNSPRSQPGCGVTVAGYCCVNAYLLFIFCSQSVYGKLSVLLCTSCVMCDV